jgi:hypothetical protein
MKIATVTNSVFRINFAILKCSALFIIRISSRHFFQYFFPFIAVQINLMYFCNSMIEFWLAKVCHCAFIIK